MSEPDCLKLLPVSYENLKSGKFYFRYPDCSILFMIETDEIVHFAVLVGKILKDEKEDIENFDLKRVYNFETFFEFENFPFKEQFFANLRESGKYYEKAINVIEKTDKK